MLTGTSTQPVRAPSRPSAFGRCANKNCRSVRDRFPPLTDDGGLGGRENCNLPLWNGIKNNEKTRDSLKIPAIFVQNTSIFTPCNARLRANRPPQAASHLERAGLPFARSDEFYGQNNMLRQQRARAACPCQRGASSRMFHMKQNKNKIRASKWVFTSSNSFPPGSASIENGAKPRACPASRRVRGFPGSLAPVIASRAKQSKLRLAEKWIASP